MSTIMTHFILILATFLLFSPPSSIALKITPIFDINGRPLETGVNYYILPVIRGRGGGLTMSPINSTESCPLYVAQENHEVSNGLPLKLYTTNPKEKRIPLGSDVNIVFDAASICVQSTGWSLGFDEATGRQHVGTGGTIGNPGVDTLSNWFRVEKDGNNGMYDYKISYCPGVCIFCTVMCGDVGVFNGDDGTRFLGLTYDNRPLLVMFKKA